MDRYLLLQMVLFRMLMKLVNGIVVKLLLLMPIMIRYTVVQHYLITTYTHNSNDGYYIFDNLVPGDYIVQFGTLSEFERTIKKCRF
ncbi:MAG: hypothetical protein R2771_02060 [Saprospiraceae bacterium]